MDDDIIEFNRSDDDGQPRADEDSPWKEALESYFPDFIELFFPGLYAEIDWSQGYEFLDSELQRIAYGAALGRLHVDKLVKVTLRSEGSAWVLVHVEVQGAPDAGFAKRIYVYNYRSFDHYDRAVISIAVLTDRDPNWRPTHYGYEVGGFRLDVTFPIVKLLDYESRREELEASQNPFAVLALAQLEARATEGDAELRLAGKVGLVRRLREKGFDREQVVKLFRLIDWLLLLPPGLDSGFRDEIARIEEPGMAYVTSIERLAKEEGREEGIVLAGQEAVIDILEARFSELPVSLMEAIRRTEGVTRLRDMRLAALRASTVEEFQTFVQSAS